MSQVGPSEPMDRDDDRSRGGNTLFDKAGMKDQHQTWVRKFVAEFIALTIFTFVAATSANSFNNLEEATAQGLTIALLVISFGHISGAHINPAVTLGVLISGGISLIGALIYWLAQFLGSILGGFLCWCVMRNGLYMALNGGTTPLYHHNGTLFEGYLMETFITFILVWAVLMCAVHQENQVLAALAIGFSVFIGVITGGPVSDGSMNPARSLGPLVTYSGAYRDHNYAQCTDYTTKCIPPHEIWKTYWIPFVGPMTGAILAGVLYRIFYSDVPTLKSKYSPRRNSSGRNSGTGYGTL